MARDDYGIYCTYLFTKQTPPYGYRILHYKLKTVWRPFQVYRGNPYICMFLGNRTPEDIKAIINYLVPLLLTWFNLNRGMDKYHMPSKVWGEIPYRFVNLWSLGMDKQFHLTIYNGCNYLLMLGFKLTHFSKRGPWCCFPGTEAIVRLSFCQYSNPYEYELTKNIPQNHMNWCCHHINTK